MYDPTRQYEIFMRESNAIEGELDFNADGTVKQGRLNPGDLEAVEYAVQTELSSISDILNVHGILGRHLNADWTGKFRTVNNRVGNYKCPPHQRVQSLMEDYMRDYSKLASWEAHNRFEAIHPFRDLNGRTGRLIWLVKSMQEGYRFGLPFLHKYYYQTLDRDKLYAFGQH